MTDAEQADIVAFYQELRFKDGLSMKMPCAIRWFAFCSLPTFSSGMDLEAPGTTTADRSSGRQRQARHYERRHAAGSRRVPIDAPRNHAATVPRLRPRRQRMLRSDAAAFGLRSGKSAELFPLVQHAGRRTDGARGGGRSASARGAGKRRPSVCCADPRVQRPDAGIRRQLAGLPPLRRKQHRRSQSLSHQFTNDLRESMFEEPIHFSDGHHTEQWLCFGYLLYGKYTFVNGDLARHYEMKDVQVPSGGWVRVDNADQYGRGGLLPMAVFLTQNSPGLRTSPVKRGYWVVRRVLGEYIPPPPPTVPALPKDESQLGELTLRQALVRHRQDPACAGCHARFDSYGLVFEGYGPTGERRAARPGRQAHRCARALPRRNRSRRRRRTPILYRRKVGSRTSSTRWTGNYMPTHWGAACALPTARR